YLQNLGIERPSGGQVVTERLFDHNAAPAPVLLLEQARRAQAGNHSTEQAIGDRQIKEIIPSRARFLVQLGQNCAKLPEHLRTLDVASEIGHPLGDPAPGRRVETIRLELAAALTYELVHHRGQALFPIGGRQRCRRDPDELELGREATRALQVVEGRGQQALGQVAGGAEDHHGARRRGSCLVRARSLSSLRSHLLLLSISVANSTTRAGSKPNLCCSSFSGAEAPKVLMPTTLPYGPT